MYAYYRYSITFVLLNNYYCQNKIYNTTEESQPKNTMREVISGIDKIKLHKEESNDVYKK
ncbi:hypothetical protein D5Q71_29145 [Escherichia coli]|nr:hypothetical protein [Escherichia coli]